MHTAASTTQAYVSLSNNSASASFVIPKTSDEQYLQLPDAVVPSSTNKPTVSVLLSSPTLTPIDAKVDPSGFVYKTYTNSITIIGYIGQDVHGKFPSTIEGKNVTVVGRETGWLVVNNEWLYLNKGYATFVSVEIPDSVMIIGDYAFEYCLNLENVTIPDSVSNIGFHSFHGCPKLEDITIPASVGVIDIRAFDANYRLVITCYQDSSAHRYCLETNTRFRLIEPTTTPPPTISTTTTDSPTTPTTTVDATSDHTITTPSATTPPPTSSIPSTTVTTKPGDDNTGDTPLLWIPWIGGALLAIGLAVTVILIRNRKHDS